MTELARSSSKRAEKTPPLPLLSNDGAISGSFSIFNVIFVFFTPSRCYLGTKSKFQPPSSVRQCLMEPPCPRCWTPPVPVWVGVDGPRDGYEHPRDKSCLQGQLEGDFLGEQQGFSVNRIKHIGKGLGLGVTPRQPCDTVSGHVTHPPGTASPRSLP